jgi:predicted permease
MSRFRRLFRLALPARANPSEVGDELALHIELRAAELVAQGWEPAAAEREARRLFGDHQAVGEQCLTIDQRRARTVRTADRFDEIRQDVGFAIRSFRRRPLFTALAIGILAVGIGATTAVFSLVNAILLRPLPYRDPAGLVFVHGRSGDGRMGVSEKEHERYRAEPRLFASVGAWTYGTATVTGTGEPERLRAAYADADLLPTLGIRPRLGRGFTAEEDRPGSDQVVLLGHGYWQSRWSSNPGIVGQPIIVNGQSRVVVGVLPAGVKLPTDYAGPSADLILPLALDPTPDPRNLHYLDLVARIAPVPAATLAAGLDAVAQELVAAIPQLPRQFRIATVPLTEFVLGGARPAVVMLSVAVVVLLVLACANVAGMLLANAETRHREFSVRSALGAGGGRLVRQVIVETLVLSLFGGTAGLIGSGFALRGILALSPPNLPRADSVRIDAIVVAVAVAVTLAAALGAGLMPALRLRRRSVAGALNRETRGGTAGRERHRARKSLVLTEVALAVAIATAAGLVGKSWFAILSTDPGFPIGDKLTFQLSLPGEQYASRGARWRFYREATAAVAQIPGADAVGAISSLPLGDQTGDWGFRIEGRPEAGPNERNPYADRLIATDGYFEAMGVPIVAGRTFQATDDTTHPPVVILSESVANRYWPNGNALGSRIRLSSDVDPVWRTVIGIASDVRSRGLEQQPRSEFYFPHAQTPASPNANAASTMSIVVRTTGDPASLAGAVRQVIRRLDPGIPVSRVQTMERVLDATLSVRRFQLILLGFFAASALVLVAMGVYGVVAFLVQQRGREFGVRLALGADRRRILGLVLGDGVRLAAGGVAVGLVGATVAGRLLSSLLYQAKPFDPAVFLGVATVVLLVVLAASWVPAARAAETSPGASLQSE